MSIQRKPEDLVYETENYDVYVAEVHLSPTELGTPKCTGYACVNKLNGIQESEHRTMPGAMQTADLLNATLIAMHNESIKETH